MLLNADADARPAPSGSEPVDRWILSRLAATLEEVGGLYETYQFSTAVKVVYGFVWNEFCDWYLEALKLRLYGEDAEAKLRASETALYVLESRAEHPRRLDPVGQLLMIVGLASLTFAIIEGPQAGWTSVHTLGVFGLALASFAFLIPYELHRREPLLEMRFFRSAPFSGASAIAVLTFAGIGGFLFLNTLYLQDVRGLSPLHAGLYLLPMAAMILVFAPVSGRIVGHRGARIPIVTAALALLLIVLKSVATSSLSTDVRARLEPGPDTDSPSPQTLRL